MKNKAIIQNMPAAQLVKSAIELSRGNEKSSSLILPNLGFGEGSFIKGELAEIFFETIKDWRVKNRRSEKLTLEVLQMWTRYFRLKMPGITDQIELSFRDHYIEWNHSKGELQISGGKTELSDDEISKILNIFGIGRYMLSRSKMYDADTEGLKYYSYLLIYREEISKSVADRIEKEGYEIEDAPDMDSVLVSGGTKELSEEELEFIAGSFYVTDYEVHPWHKPDGTWFYELYYGPRFAQFKGPDMTLTTES